jgi:hypothetical protein
MECEERTGYNPTYLGIEKLRVTLQVNSCIIFLLCTTKLRGVKRNVILEGKILANFSFLNIRAFLHIHVRQKSSNLL